MNTPTKRPACRANPAQWLRGAFVVSTILISLLLAYLPGVAASSDGLPSPTPALEPSAGPADASPSPDPTTDPSPAPPEQTPLPSASDEPQPTSGDAGSPLPSSSPQPSPSTPVLQGVGLVVNHVSAGTLGLPGSPPSYLAPDTPLTNLPRFQVFRLRFEVHNTDASDAAWQPALDLVQGDGSAVVLPAGAEASGQPFYAAPEWVPDGSGTVIGSGSAVIAGDDGAPAGIRSMGVNPLPEMTLAAQATTIVEFSVRATVAAVYQRGYEFRLVDAAGYRLSSPDVRVTMAAAPAIVLTPGQRSGIPDESDGSAAPPLRLSATSAGSIHNPAYSLATDSCAACHRTHDAPGSSLTAAPTQYGLCSACHDGVNAPDVTAAYTSAPANDEADRAYYQHPVECSECHNPHNVTSSASTAGPAGWTASGLIAAAGGVAVTNGAAGSAPAYALLSVSRLGYQLCLTCHSGYAALPSNAGQPPSRYVLDAGVEFNPANGSYHPIEAPGTNQTDAMQSSLDGTSPYKLWDLTTDSVLRCESCHGDAQALAAAVANGTPPGEDATLPVHASSQRGLLLAAYQDRILNGPLDPYSANDFALCFLCHSEAPFRDTSGNVRSDTNFRYHGLHVSGANMLDHGSDGTNIDQAGDGGGLATCAECHFRIHSPAYAVNDQVAGARLVNFAPNVTGPTGMAINWSPASAEDPGSCTLKCHGQPHAPKTY